MEIQILLHLILVWAVTVPQVVLAEDRNNGDKTTKMITGLAAGLSFVIGFVVLIVTLWCCCCSQLTDKRRVMPSDDQDQSTSTSADSRPTSATSSS